MDSFKETNIQSAIYNLHIGRISSIRAAAAAYNIPRNTLYRRYTSQSLTRQNAHEIQQLLSSKQEEELVRWIYTLEKAGNAPNHAQLKEMVVRISSHTGGLERVGINWVYRFLQRHPELRTKIGVKIDA